MFILLVLINRGHKKNLTKEGLDGVVMALSKNQREKERKKCEKKNNFNHDHKKI